MKKFTRVLALLLTFVMLTATGCGSKKEEASAPEGNAETKTEATAEEKKDAKAETKDTLTIAQSADPVSLDPYGTTDTPAIRVASCMFETLVRLDDEGNIAPALAESWEIVDDCTYVFKLREGVKFHNGEELKASDIAFSFEKIAESPHASSLRATIDFENSKVVDDYTFEMKMTEPFGPILNHLAHPVMAIVNEKAYTEAGDAVGQKPVGTGPYKFVSWEASDRIILAKNEEYWGEAPAIPNVIWRTIPEVATRSIEVEAGGVDIAVDIQATDIARLENSKDVKIFKNVASSVNFIGLNTTMEPFSDVRVRQAINYAIDKSAIYNVVYQGTGTIAEAPMSPVVWAYNDELPQYEYNIEKAKELLAEAGYPDGFKMTMTTDESQQRQDTAEMVQSQLAEIGIEVEIRPLERTTYIGEVCAGTLEAFSLGWSSDTGDPDYALYASFHSSQHGEGGNMSFYTNPEVDKLLETGRTSTDQEERKEAYMKAQEIVWEEVPCIFLQCPEDLYAYNADLKNVGVYFDGQLRIPEISF